jgi:hypothetical protein
LKPTISTFRSLSKLSPLRRPLYFEPTLCRSITFLAPRILNSKALRRAAIVSAQ